MKTVVETGLPEFGRPTEWATVGGGHLCTTAVPVRSDGTFETGPASEQIELTLRNLEQTVKAAGGDLTDILQVIVFLTDREHLAALNEKWADWFKPPYPNRGIVIVEAIGVPGIAVLMQVQAYVGA